MGNKMGSLGNKIGSLRNKVSKKYHTKNKSLKNKLPERVETFRPVIVAALTDEDDDDDSIPPDTPTFRCEFCVERLPLNRSFNIKGCTHFYCNKCVKRYIISKLDQNVTKISCPALSCCGGLVGPDDCRHILPVEVFDRWGRALCESAFDVSERYYCPFKDCSALLVFDCVNEEYDGKSDLCPNCKRVFCARCRVPWHDDMVCEKYESLKKGGDDTLMENLAKKKKWSKCPQCMTYVEKIDGCLSMHCRCGARFCYGCGKSCGKGAFCSSCSR